MISEQTQVKDFLGTFRIFTLKLAYSNFSFKSARIIETHLPEWFLIVSGPYNCLAFRRTSNHGFIIGYSKSLGEWGQIDVYRHRDYWSHEKIAVSINEKSDDPFVKRMSEEAKEVRKRFFNGHTEEIHDLLGKEDVSLRGRMATPDSDFNDGWEEVEDLLRQV